MKDLTKAEIKILTRDSNKDLLDETYIDNERNMTRINQLETYASTITQAGDLLKRMAENAFMDRDYGHLSDSDLDYLIDDQCGRMYSIVATLEDTLRAIKAGTYRGRSDGNIIYPTSYED